ncbi:hypothetical protein LR48_Vigan11g122600 [Vigna angularis]|uniref:Uncharacterized protein n=1 Tax=Phaseolus angularis TaxID=3914 RepID=A0A0L9VTK9_PHAAN|nr:hypothetical protein LR48_Vigan11g122600 [Vigna angularis]
MLYTNCLQSVFIVCSPPSRAALPPPMPTARSASPSSTTKTSSASSLYAATPSTPTVSTPGSRRATSDGTGWKYCLRPGEGNCPDNAACNKYCLSRPFPGGGSCIGNQCCCKA